MFLTKHVVKLLFRSPLKSLFSILLTALITVLLMLELGLLHSAEQFVQEANRSYTTIAHLEYRGSQQDSDFAWDPMATAVRGTLPDNPLMTDSAVLTWNPQRLALARIRTDDPVNETSAARYRHEPLLPDAAVLLVKITNRTTSDGYVTAHVIDSLYSLQSLTETIINIKPRGLTLLANHYYLIHGEFFRGQTLGKHFAPTPFYLGQDNYETADLDSLLDIGLAATYMDVTSAEGYEIPAHTILHDYAATYSMLNNSVLLRQTASFEAETKVVKQQTYIVEGRSFLEDEYGSSTSPPIILSRSLAKLMDVTVGDSVLLDIALQADRPLIQSYLAMEGFTDTQTYIVVGLTNESIDDRHEVYIPAGNGFDLSEQNYGYSLGTVELMNEKASRWFPDSSNDMEANIRVTYYDQGYEEVVAPIRLIRQQAILLFVLTCLVSLIVVCFVSYFLIYRNRDNAQIQIRLGLSRRSTFFFMLGAPSIVSAIGITMGLILGRLFSGEVASFVSQSIDAYSNFDFSYSQSGIGALRSGVFELDISIAAYLSAAAAIGLAALSSGSLMTHYIMRAQSSSSDYRVTRMRRQRFSSTPRVRAIPVAGSYHYALLSSRRALSRALLSASLPALAILFVLQLSHSEYSDRLRRDEIDAQSRIVGHFTSSDGSGQNDLLISTNTIRELEAGNLLREMTYSSSQPYMVIGYLKAGETVEQIIYTESLAQLNDRYVQNILFRRASKMPRIYATNQLHGNVDFAYDEAINVHFLDGFDASILAEETKRADFAYAIASDTLMTAYDLELGDSLVCLSPNPQDYSIWSQVITIVGRYSKENDQGNIYAQLALVSDNWAEVEQGHLPPQRHQYAYDYNQLSFQVESGRQLTAMKTHLKDRGYSSVGSINRIRETVLISDVNFYLSLMAIDQHLLFTSLLYPLLYTLSLFLSLLVPLLLLYFRQAELSIMKRLGTPSYRRFFSIYYELAGLACVGALAALVFSFHLLGIANNKGLIISLSFITIWCLTAALSLLRSIRSLS